MSDPDPVPGLDPAPVLEALGRDQRLRVFLGHGGIETMPAKPSRRRLLLDQVAQAFEPGVRYPERQVSEFLGTLHPDYAALRRYLVDEELLTRSGGLYWRSGGTVSTSPGNRPAPDPRPGAVQVAVRPAGLPCVPTRAGAGAFARSGRAAAAQVRDSARA
jgi:hypothetical protein